jgi:amino acid transporter
VKQGVSRNQIGLAALIFSIYCCVSGGPYGLETLVKESGAFLAIVLIFLTPIVWAMPVALMSAELGSAMPDEGGYFIWVKRAFGPFWGFLCGWWTWLYSWVDVAIYPVLCIEYLTTACHLSGLATPWEAAPLLKWGMGLLIIIPLTLLNVRGAKFAGNGAIVISALLFVPVILFVILGMSQAATVHVPNVGSAEMARSAGNGLFVVLWNFLGWDSMSTVAGETTDPQRNYPKALRTAMALVTLSYVIPVWIGVSVMPDTSQWTDGAWPTIMGKIGGLRLSQIAAIGAMAGACGLFLATLLSASRLPMVMAEHGYLPKWLSKVHPRFGTPVNAVLCSSIIYTILSYQTFQELIKLDVVLYTSSIVLELAALAWLRIKEPEMARPFKIGGGWWTLVPICLGPCAIVGFAVVNIVHQEDQPLKQLMIVASALFTAPVVFWVATRSSKENLGQEEV